MGSRLVSDSPHVLTVAEENISEVPHAFSTASSSPFRSEVSVTKLCKGFLNYMYIPIHTYMFTFKLLKTYMLIKEDVKK